MTGVYGVSTWTALIAALGVIFSAVYALTLYRNVVFGEIRNPQLMTISDLNWRETAIFAPLMISTLALGLYPKLIFAVTTASSEALSAAYRAAIGA